MKTFLSTIQDNYVQNFPSQVPKKAAKSFIVTALLRAVTGCTSYMILAPSCVAAMAIIIEAVTRPIIKSIFPPESTPIIVQIIIPFTIALNSARAIAPYFGTVLQLNSLALSIMVWNNLNVDYYKNNIGMVTIL